MSAIHAVNQTQAAVPLEWVFSRTSMAYYCYFRTDTWCIKGICILFVVCGGMVVWWHILREIYPHHIAFF